MKKTLAALAVLGAFAGSAAAADVQLYGVVDEGFIYTNTKVTDEKSDNQFQLGSGLNLGSRWGLKGTEDLGNGYKVGFKLESGFNADTGTLQENRLFRREAGLTLSGPFGSVAFGRFGGLSSSCGTYDMLGYVESFDGGDGDVWGFAASDRYDNMVVYQTPRFAGLQLTAQYSFKTDSKASAKVNSDGDPEFSGDEGTSHAQRYASIGVSGEYGPAAFAVGYELTKYGANENNGGTPAVAYGRELDKDGQLVFIGGNYDFEVVQLFAEAQYFKHQTSVAGIDAELSNNTYKALGLKGYGLHLGAAAPLGAGTLTAGLYFVDFSEEYAGNEADSDYKYYGVSARYNYPLSTRTGVYVGAGYGQTKGDAAEGDVSDYKAQVTQVYCGLVHTF